MNIDKHAYCIMAHGNWKQLQLLVTLIDDRRNDIYLHVDAKAIDGYKKMGGGINKQLSFEAH